MNIRVQRTAAPAPKPEDPRKSGLWYHFYRPHVSCRLYAGFRLARCRIVPVSPLSIHPGAAVFHYGAEIL